jgi:hypothetical protein
MRKELSPVFSTAFKSDIIQSEALMREINNKRKLPGPAYYKVHNENNKR